MSGASSVLPVRLEIGRSRRLALLLLLLHLAPLIPLFLVLPVLPAAVLSLLSLVSLWFGWQRFVRRTPRNAVVEVQVSGDREWFLRRADGKGERAELLRAFVQRWLTLLVFQVRRGRRRVVILPDSVGEDDYHRLRVFLNYLQ